MIFNNMKVALIGVGRWGTILKGELSKITDIKYVCDSKTNLGPVFADPEVKAVFIATPTETHFEIASKALGAGKHVFLEKPGTDSGEKLGKLVKLAEAKKLRFAIGYEFPHHPAAKKLKELISGKGVKSVRFEWQKWGTFKDNAVMHHLCHDVSVMKYLGFDNLSPVNHHRTKVISETDIIWTEFKSDSDAYIESIINRASTIKQKTVTVLLEKGGYVWSNNELFAINLDTQALDKIDLPQTTPVANELNDFLNSETPLCNGEFALEVYKIVEQVGALRPPPLRNCRVCRRKRE